MILNKIHKFKQNHNKNKKRNLPTLFFFTDRKRFKDIFKTIKHLPKNTAIIIREYDLSYKDRLIFAREVVKIAKNNKLVTLAGKSLILALEAKTNGVHFSDNDQSWRKYLLHKKINSNFILSCSCHSEISIIKIKEFDIDFLFISPIFQTTSHPNTAAIGYRNLARITIKHKYKDIYALGGINEQNIDLLQNSRISGIGAITLFKLRKG